MAKTRIHGNSQVAFYADFMVTDGNVHFDNLRGDIILDLLKFGKIGSGTRLDQTASFVGNRGLMVVAFSRCYNILADHLNTYRIQMQFLGSDQCRCLVRAQEDSLFIRLLTTNYNSWYKDLEMIYGSISELIRLPDETWQRFQEGMKAEKEMFARNGVGMIWADVNTIGVVFSKTRPETNVMDIVYKMASNGGCVSSIPPPFADQSVNVLGRQHKESVRIADTASSNSYVPGIPNYMYSTFTGLQSTFGDIKSKISTATSWGAGLSEECKPSAVKSNPPDLPDRSKIPRNWSKFAPGEITRVNILGAGDSEYRDTERYFIDSMGAESTRATVLHIGRIENPGMYKSYHVQYVYVTENNPDGTTIERRLWHGTSADTISEINTNGFNRSFCGKNGTLYGRGVYFARYACYSNRYAKPDDDGLRHMYLCKVLTGQFTRGEPSQRVAPPKDPLKPSVKFDSVVNDVTDPEIFVVFSDFRAYPEYLITYTFSG